MRQVTTSTGPDVVGVPPAVPEAAGETAADEVIALLGTLQRIGQKRQPSMRLGIWILTCLIALIVVLISLSVYAATGSLLKAIWYTLTMSGLLILPFNMRRCVASREQKETVRRLAELEDVRAVGALTEALSWPESTVYEAVIPALTRLLPRLKASDAELLDAGHRRILCAHLTRGDEAFACSILKALEQVGGEEAVPFVERLAHGPASGFPRYRFSSRVQEAARECLPALKARVKEGRARQTLLRPAGPSEDPAVTLLRPAGRVEENDPALLLRPAEGQEQGGA